MVKSTTIQLVLSIKITIGWKMTQIDIQNSFLHGPLFEIIYMQQPPGFIDPHKFNFFNKLHKVIYGLKQAPGA